MYIYFFAHFYTPVFRRDVLWYGEVCLSGSPYVSHSFPHFSPTCFDILRWNFACSFLLMNIRSSLSVINLRQFLWELCPFWNLEYWKYTVFRIFLLHALTYWTEILHMTLFYCTTDQVRVSSICVNCCVSYARFGTYNTGNTQFFALFFTSFGILSWQFAHDFLLLYYISVWVSSICVNFCRSYAPIAP